MHVSAQICHGMVVPVADLYAIYAPRPLAGTDFNKDFISFMRVQDWWYPLNMSSHSKPELGLYGQVQYVG